MICSGISAYWNPSHPAPQFTNPLGKDASFPKDAEPTDEWESQPTL